MSSSLQLTLHRNKWRGSRVEMPTIQPEMLDRVVNWTGTLCTVPKPHNLFAPKQDPATSQKCSVHLYATWQIFFIFFTHTSSQYTQVKESESGSKNNCIRICRKLDTQWWHTCGPKSSDESEMCFPDGHPSLRYNFRQIPCSANTYNMNDPPPPKKKKHSNTQVPRDILDKSMFKRCSIPGATCVRKLSNLFYSGYRISDGVECLKMILVVFA